MMFNPLAPSELILAVARLLRQAAEPAAGPAGPDEYRRSQLLSASSLARHLAAEQAAAAGLLAWLCEQLDQALADDPRPPVATARATIAAATTDAEIGTALTTLLAALGDTVQDRALRGAIHTLLAELVDREVAVLAGAEA